MGQTNAAFKSVFDVLTLPYQKPDLMMKSIAKCSGVLESILKVSEGSDKPVTSIKTFEGRDVKIPIAANYPVTYANRSKFNISHGDIKLPEQEKNLIHATIDAVDKAFTMGIYTYDLQLLKNKGMQGYVDWIKNYWTDTMYGQGISMLDSIYNGLGASAINAITGLTRPDFIGMATAISNSSYGGKAYTDWYEWQGQSFDASSGTIFGLAQATLLDTIAHATTPSTSGNIGTLNAPFFNLIQSALEKTKQFSKSKRMVVILHPAVYQYLWLPSLEANIAGAKVSTSQMKMKETVGVERSATFMIDGTPVYKEDASLPTASIGSAPTYIFPSNKIYIVDLDSWNLEAESSNNFVVSDWEPVQGQYNSLQKSVSSTLLFYTTHRFSNSVITLNSTLAAECVTNYGI